MDKKSISKSDDKESISKLEESLDDLKVSLDSNVSDTIASSFNDSLDDFLIDCHVIIEEIGEKKMSMVWINDFKALSKLFDIMWELFKECIKKNPELITKLSQDANELWKNAREIGNTVYKTKIQDNNDRTPYNVANNEEKISFLEEIKTYLTDEEKKQISKLLKEAKKIIDSRKEYVPDVQEQTWMANDKYVHWLTDA